MGCRQIWKSGKQTKFQWISEKQGRRRRETIRTFLTRKTFKLKRNRTTDDHKTSVQLFSRRTKTAILFRKNLIDAPEETDKSVRIIPRLQTQSGSSGCWETLPENLLEARPYAIEATITCGDLSLESLFNGLATTDWPED